MAGLRNTLARLHQLRQRFERKLSQAGQTATAPTAATRLREISGFGTNPGGLRMFAYVPKKLENRPALVVALHGCSQTAGQYDCGSGWSTLADAAGFVVLYPQQQPINNPKNCFSWFLPADTARDSGEAQSIRQMIERAAGDFNIDRSRVFITGLSAGGAMAGVMLATYPEVFAGGAIIAGLPYGCASSAQEAFELMFNERSVPSRELGDRVRAASRHRGPWPKVSVWHGSADPIVKPGNAANILRQWIDVQALAPQASDQKTFSAYTHRIWNDSSGRPVVEEFSIPGMAHGLPVAPGTAPYAHGAAGPFFLNVGVSSTYHIARSWELVGAATAPSIVNLPARAATVDAGPHELAPIQAMARADTSVDAECSAHQSKTGLGVDPNAVIAAAFRAAGLPAPAASPDSLNVAPASIIAAALKAAGLIRR
jgi:poly(hydroxyalkanoate) depolymerase family esterase